MVQAVVDPEGRGQVLGVQKYNAIVPAGEGECLLAEGGKEHLILHHLTSKKKVLEGFP